MNRFIKTYTGKKFYPLDPSPEMLDEIDIAHALSLICRFTGHCKFHYSVAMHSILTSLLCEASHPINYNFHLWGLLHDAAEAYISDVARGFKDDYFKDIEHNIMNCVVEKFGLFPSYMPNEIKTADEIMLVTEGKQLLHNAEIETWNIGQQPIDIKIEEFKPKTVEELFLKRLELCQQRKRAVECNLYKN